MTMKILLVGGGGREHAIAEALCQKCEVELFSVMAKKNPGIWMLAKRVLIEKETNIKRIAGFAIGGRGPVCNYRARSPA